MWNYPPEQLCRNHLLGEHFELHKFRYMFVKQRDMTTRIQRNQIFPRLMGVRHDLLVAEMLSRGYNHNSPYVMPDLEYLENPEELV